MHIFALTATYELRVSRKSHLRDHPTPVFPCPPTNHGDQGGIPNFKRGRTYFLCCLFEVWEEQNIILLFLSISPERTHSRNSLDCLDPQLWKKTQPMKSLRHPQLCILKIKSSRDPLKHTRNVNVAFYCSCIVVGAFLILIVWLLAKRKSLVGNFFYGMFHFLSLCAEVFKFLNCVACCCGI